jgi:hypothetical protein
LDLTNIGGQLYTAWPPLYHSLGGPTCSYHMCLECSNPITCFHLNTCSQNIPRTWYYRGWQKGSELIWKVYSYLFCWALYVHRGSFQSWCKNDTKLIHPKLIQPSLHYTCQWTIVYILYPHFFLVGDTQDVVLSYIYKYGYKYMCVYIHIYG